MNKTNKLSREVAEKLNSQELIALRIGAEGRWDDFLVTYEVAQDPELLGHFVYQWIRQVQGKEA